MKKYIVYIVIAVVCLLFLIKSSPNCIQCEQKMVYSEPLVARMLSMLSGETFLHKECVDQWVLDNPVEFDKNGSIITNLSICE